MDLERVRDRRAGEMQTALKGLTVVREQMNVDRLTLNNALKALLRTQGRGADAGKVLTTRLE